MGDRRERIVTLQEWSDKTGIPVNETGLSKAKTVISGRENPLHTILWNLEDHKVTTATGVMVWLIPTR